jgi:hypothetical protein
VTTISTERVEAAARAMAEAVAMNYDHNSAIFLLYARAALDVLSPPDCDAAHLRDVLTSIANNTCCDGCQQAAKWARSALMQKPIGDTLMPKQRGNET